MNNIQGIAYAEFHVENLPKATALLVDGFGFTAARPEGVTALASTAGTDETPETAGTAGLERIGLRAGGVSLVLSSAADPEHPAAAFVRKHGDGVAVIAVACLDPEAAYAHAVEHGAVPVSPADLTIAGFGDSALRFVAEAPADGAGANGADGPPLQMEAIDHVAVCVPAGTLASTVDFCEQVLELRRIFGDYIKVGTQGMDSIVMQSGSGAVTFTLLEPDASGQPGQINDFLDGHGGMGVQHLALLTGDIADGIRNLGERGVEFLKTPASYYDVLEDRVGPTGIPLETLRELNILVDQDHGGQLYQIFTRSVHARRTYFFELIDRRGASTFGTANITALYEAIARQEATSAR